jgi:Xaa-Pro aminopeptidase
MMRTIQISMFFCALLSIFSGFAQGGGSFKLANVPVIDDELTADFFKTNRKRLRDTMPDSSVFILFAAPRKSKANDIDFKYHQDPDFYYFTGVKEPNALILILKDSATIDGVRTNEILFVETKDSKKEQWTGRMLGIEGAMETSGVAVVQPNETFKTLALPFTQLNHVLYNQHQNIERDDHEHPGDLMSMSKHFHAKMERAGIEPKMHEGEDLCAYLRQHKAPEEIKMLQQAMDITCEAQKAAMHAIAPGMTEYQIEALIAFTFRNNGAEGEAFPSIVASGENGAIMHYTDNNSLLIPGDLVVMDIGAQYEGYSADVTRTVPVSGTFTEEQAIIYQIVLDAQTVAIRYATPGYKFWTPHEEAYRTIGKGLIKHGIIEKWADIGDYFIHGTSHYLGLDVHDAGIYSSLQPGEVMTVEPGIYIPEGSPCDPKWWNIYVRIEDDILITDGPAKVLSSGAPKTITEIEKLMDKGQASLD